ncbi:MAG: cysteine desulfurase [Clostridiales bacterium]|nr:cysteine desulfurase [Clostridiales bacterium]
MFFDNASTTQIDKTIIADFEKLNNELFYNPGGLYAKGRGVASFIEDCRNSIKDSIGASASDSFIFTGSATEANNMALMGTVKKHTRKILVSMGEHPSVYNVGVELKNRGFNVEFIPLEKDGTVSAKMFEKYMTEDTDIVSIMYTSNETGAINDIATLVEIAKDINPKVIFHCDAVQGVGKFDINVEDLGVDMLTMSAHKIHGMKGVGGLYVKKNIQLKPLILGGGQEGGLRSGTENTLGIYSMSRALEIATENLKSNSEYVLSLKTRLIDILEDSGLVYVIHSKDNASPYVLSVSFIGCRAETILNMLSDRGVMVSNGSACSSKKSGNRILEAMGCPKDEIESNIRISFSKNNTIEEIENMATILINVVKEYLAKVR